MNPPVSPSTTNQDSEKLWYYTDEKNQPVGPVPFGRLQWLAAEQGLVGDNLAQLESLAAKALALVDSEKDAKGRLAAIRTAAEVIRQRADYQIAVGHVQQRDGKTENRESEAEAFVAQLAADYTPETTFGIHTKLREARQKVARFKLPYSNNHPG